MYKIILFLIVLLNIVSCNEHFSLTSPYTVDKEYVKSYDSCYDDNDCINVVGKDYNCNPEDEDGHKCFCDSEKHICQYLCRDSKICPSIHDHGKTDNSCYDEIKKCLCQKGYEYDIDTNQCSEINPIKNLEVALGHNHTCAIKNGALYCWGSNDTGKLGINDNSNDDFDTPQRVGNDSTWLLVSNARDFTCALKRANFDIYNVSLYCWGKGVRTPQKVGDKKNWKQLISGNNEILLLDKDGYLYNITDGSFKVDNIDSPETFPKNDSSQWLTISKGNFHYCGIKTDGKRYCMGTNYNGEFGNSKYNDDSNMNDFIEINDGINWKDIKCGNDYTCGINDNDKVYCWGDNRTEEVSGSDTLAVNSDEQKVLNPMLIKNSDNWISITAGHDYTCGIKKDSNSLYCWGDNTDNQFGQTDTIGSGEESEYNTFCPNDICSTPVKLKTNLNTSDIIIFKTNNYEDNSYKCIIDSNNRLYCWGHNDHKQLGVDDSSCEKQGIIIKCLYPIEVKFPE